MKALFIGTRIEALEKIESITNVVKIITTKDSFVEKKRNDRIIVNKYNLKDINLFLMKSEVDLIFSSGYPYLLPKDVIRSNKLFINSHPSYLPSYRGRKCIKRAFENKEEYFGCTLHHMNEKADEGKIIYQKKVSLKGYKLSEIYEFIFSKLEVEVIENGMKKIFNK